MSIHTNFVNFGMPSFSQTDFNKLNDEIRIAKACAMVSQYISPRKEVELNLKPKGPSQEVMTAAETVVAAGMMPLLLKDLKDEMNQNFHWVEADIKRYLQMMQSANLSVNPAQQIKIHMDELLDRLYAWYTTWARPLKIFEPGASTSKNASIVYFHPYFIDLLHDYLPTSPFGDYLLVYLQVSLPVVPSSDSTSSSANHLTAPSRPVPNAHLFKLSIIPKYLNLLAQMAFESVDTLVWREAGGSDAVNQIIEKAGRMGKVELPDAEVRDGNWSAKKLGKLREDVGLVVIKWLDTIMSVNDTGFQKRSNIITRLEYRMQTVLFELRTAELFDIIVMYPDGNPALEDLKECLLSNKAERRAHLVRSLTESIKRRLLHPGPQTVEVIDAYVAAIRSLRILDPAGVLLHAIAEPIREHLKQRPDTIRTIAELLVDGSDTIKDGEGDEDETKPINIRDDVAEDWTDQSWEPEPIDAAPEFRSRKASDIISTLVGICSDRTLIITELSELLSRRLLAVKSYDLDDEIRSVEILKLRFGESALPKCEVMLKDFAESKRIDSHVQSVSPSILHPLIFSRHYWPEISTKAIQVPLPLLQLQETWNAYYSRHKQGRHLQWRPQAGTVGMKIELEDRLVEVEATMLQAAVLHRFERRKTQRISRIAEKLGNDDLEEVEKAINFWVNHGVLKETKKGKYTLLETGGAEMEAEMVNHGLEDEPAPVMAPAATARAELDGLRWPEVQGIMQTLAAPAPVTDLQAILHLEYPPWTAEDVEEVLFRAEREGLVSRRMEADGKSFWGLV